MVYLLNAAMMPSPNLMYLFSEIDERTFIEELNSAIEMGTLRSFMGYKQNQNYLYEKHGINVELNFDRCDVKPGDTLLVMRLPYRQFTIKKGETVREDFEYGIVAVEEWP